MMICGACGEREVQIPSSGECRRCYNRRWFAAHPGYAAAASRQKRSDPAKATRDREASRRWKRENRERNQARDRAYRRRGRRAASDGGNR